MAYCIATTGQFNFSLSNSIQTVYQCLGTNNTARRAGAHNMVCTVWLGTQLIKNMTDGHNLMHPNDIDACTARLHIVQFSSDSLILPQL